MVGNKIFYLLCLLLLSFMKESTAAEVIQLTSQEVYAMLEAGEVDALVDVRSESEFFDPGHIANATLVADLASNDILSPEELKGCEYCRIIVYCQSGNRAGRALEKMVDNGFKGQLYNGLGINQWRDANYSLVTTESVAAPCAVDQELSDQCKSNVEMVDDTSSASYTMMSIFSITFLSFLCLLN